jgi:type IV fimbrial biogenesis protein FimT
MHPASNALRTTTAGSATMSPGRNESTRSAGFTLIEAMIVLAVASLLLCIAVPACASLLARSRAAATRAALLASLTQAIQHAAVTGSEVVLCPADGQDCRNSWDWSGGWIAYADIDGDRRHDPGETLLHAEPALPGAVRLLTSKGRKRLVFQPNGGNAGSNVTFTLCYGRGAASAVTLVLANSGQLRAGKPTATAARTCAAGGA